MIFARILACYLAIVVFTFDIFVAILQLLCSKNSLMLLFSYWNERGKKMQDSAMNAWVYFSAKND